MIGLQSDSWMYNVTPKHTVPLRMKVSLSCEGGLLRQLSRL